MSSITTTEIDELVVSLLQVAQALVDEGYGGSAEPCRNAAQILKDTFLTEDIKGSVQYRESSSPSLATLALAEWGGIKQAFPIFNTAPETNIEKALNQLQQLDRDLAHVNERQSTPSDSFSVRMSEELAREFDEIQKDTGMNGAEVFRRAIALYKIAKKASTDGEQVILRAKDNERLITHI